MRQIVRLPEVFCIVHTLLPLDDYRSCEKVVNQCLVFCDSAPTSGMSVPGSAEKQPVPVANTWCISSPIIPLPNGNGLTLYQEE